ncbi:L7Ae/L30e/S12e/Gadd45 family ribosomal protein, partial [Staphylococcus arlettae]
MNKENIVNFLGLAMRAGKVKTGEAVVLNEIKKNKVKLVIIASDASDNTTKVVQNK